MIKRMNRKKLIEEIESLRQGFRSAHDLIAKDAVSKMSMAAYHHGADSLIVSLGGESCPIEKQKE